MDQFNLIERPQDQAFSDIGMEAVEGLLELQPFSDWVAEKLAKGGNDPLSRFRDILLNESRLLDYDANQLILREGDHGSSLFVIITGSVSVLFQVRTKAAQQNRRKGWLGALSQLWSNARWSESRDISRYTQEYQIQGHTEQAAVTVPLDQYKKQSSETPVTLRAGSIFGEVAALRRSTRTATVVANEPMRVLELRWQGIRDFMSASKEFKRMVDELYRQRSLRSHLLAMPLFKTLPKEHLQAVIEQAVFETVGKQDWNVSFKKLDDGSLDARLKDEPMIVEEGDYANSLIMLRSGFARVSKKFHKKQRTVAYMRRGDVIGLRALSHNARESRKMNFEFSVRAIGYADIIRVPASTFEQHVFPHCDQKVFAHEQLSNLQSLENENRLLMDEVLNREANLLEFFVERRFINGTKAMVVNTDRCTNCDDCVRACAAAHDNNPRFVRHGHRLGKFLVANACMHCFDPVCMIGCPTGAISRNPSGGEIFINDDVCIGCATCANSCPYNNIRMVHVLSRKGEMILDTHFTPIMKATKCDLCKDQKVSPSCENACPHGALRRVDIHELDKIQDWLQS